MNRDLAIKIGRRRTKKNRSWKENKNGEGGRGSHREREAGEAKQSSYQNGVFSRDEEI